ncbi:hypothetical protein CEXT_656361 [Caerostris extrusa]|uniref:non-specific serine/threonine protein kinase n=1 Tax=Caerostris extrusa TaxID=172846 RepID=A0AAV4SKB7_CAEEX|nr:hypothetical protein CEXT_656361 [Caerostris extrusa]
MCVSVGCSSFRRRQFAAVVRESEAGVFHIPHFVPPECQDLLRGMIEVCPEKRMTGSKSELELELPMKEAVQTHIIPTVEDLDPDVLASMTHNTEKVVYFLLLDRKRRKPAYEDETEVIIRNRSESAFSTSLPCSVPPDPPRKRVDTCHINGRSGPR